MRKYVDNRPNTQTQPPPHLGYEWDSSTWIGMSVELTRRFSLPIPGFTQWGVGQVRGVGQKVSAESNRAQFVNAMLHVSE